MRAVTVKGVRIDDTFAEAFGMRATALIITADNARWARQAAQSMTGFATSVIGCGCEAGIDCELSAKQTPDGRPGVRVLLFAVSTAELQKQLQARVAQCVLTSPGSACYAGIEGEEVLRLGNALRYFGDGWQISKRFGAKHFWRIPVMDGEFVCEATTGLTKKAVGGGNLLIIGRTSKTTRAAAEAAAAAIAKVPDAIAPFPGGIVRSGSKVGSRYKFLGASTNDAFCPSLRGLVPSALPEEVNSVLEIVIDGLDVQAVERAIGAGILAACVPGVLRIAAGNYQGKLGQHRIVLHKVLKEAASS